VTTQFISLDGVTVYLVGGAVRDELLGREVSERDWVVVGGTPELMLKSGFKPVGKDFPVFLHPESHEEYALARTERKTAPGYYGFDIHASSEITLEQDLSRRDLTINAMARDSNGVLIDPHAGRNDLDNRRLRHVSPAFKEDPLRVLRVARFAARYHALGFRVVDETLELMESISAGGELTALAAERVWRETVRALGERHPVEYFRVLRACGALAVLFPELDRLYGVPQPVKWHPEVDTGVHNEMALEQVSSMSTDPEVRFAVLCHDLGKGTTPREILPSHHGHEERSASLSGDLCERLRTPRAFRDIAEHTARYHTVCHQVLEHKPATLLKTLLNLDGLRKPERFEKFLIACEADARGRTGFENRDYPQADYMRGALAALLRAQAEIGERARQKKGDIAEAVYEIRLKCIVDYCNSTS
jgi:tRNA nucleotidyltransferase (CCA-adding enzyme)